MKVEERCLNRNPFTTVQTVEVCLLFPALERATKFPVPTRRRRVHTSQCSSFRNGPRLSVCVDVLRSRSPCRESGLTVVSATTRSNYHRSSHRNGSSTDAKTYTKQITLDDDRRPHNNNLPRGGHEVSHPSPTLSVPPVSVTCTRYLVLGVGRSSYLFIQFPSSTLFSTTRTVYPFPSPTPQGLVGLRSLTTPFPGPVEVERQW